MCLLLVAIATADNMVLVLLLLLLHLYYASDSFPSFSGRDNRWAKPVPYVQALTACRQPDASKIEKRNKSDGRCKKLSG